MNKRDLLKKYGHVFKQPVSLYENFNSSKKPLKESYKVYVFHNTACAERRPTEPQDIWDFQEEDCSNEDQVLDYICNDLGLCDYDDYDNLQELIDLFSQDFGEGSPIVYRIEKDGKTIFQDSAGYFEGLKNDLQIQLEGEQDKLYSENGVQREDIIDWLEKNYPDLYDEAESVFEDRYGDELENAFADDIESFIAEEDEDAWEEYRQEFKIVNESLKEGANSEGYELVAKGYLLYHPYPTDWDVEDIAEEVCANCFNEDYENCDPEISYACYQAASDYLDNAGEDLEEAKEFNFDKLNKKLHGNIKLKNESLLREAKSFSLKELKKKYSKLVDKEVIPQDENILICVYSTDKHGWNDLEKFYDNFEDFEKDYSKYNDEDNSYKVRFELWEVDDDEPVDFVDVYSSYMLLESFEGKTLKESLPKDLAYELNNTYEDRHREFVGLPPKQDAPLDYNNCYEITADELLKMKKRGEPLDNVFIMQNYGMVALDASGRPDEMRSSANLRHQHQLKRALNFATKIYVIPRLS